MVLELHQVWKSFGTNAVLRGVDLSVRPSEILTVLGASGSGKSVLLKLIIGLLPLDRGEIVFDGQHVETMTPAQLTRHRLRVGMVFQGAALFDSLSVAENVAYGLREHFARTMNEAAIRARVDWALEAVGLQKSGDVEPAALSGGMRKRVGVARTIAVRPEVILYDEPTTGLDPVNAARIAELIVRLRHQLAVTSLIVTHDMATAFSVSDRLAFIHEGVVAALGTPDEIRADTNPWVHDFITGHAPREQQDVAAAGGTP